MPISKLRPSFTFTEDRLKELQAVVPEAFTDGKINWDTLREALGEHLEDETREHFGLFWPGKREARRLVAIPSKGTLIPQPGEGVDEENTHNIFIEGDNLEVLKLLQKSYAGRVKMIYIDPPYNTGSDFVYKDDFDEPIEDYLKKTGQIESDGVLLTTNAKTDGRFHSNWLTMMYSRLRLARNLLNDEGSLWISIDDNEKAHLQLMCNEIFGEENFVATIIWEKRTTRENRRVFSFNHDYILCYSVDKNLFQSARNMLPMTDELLARYSNPDNDPRGNWQSVALTAQEGHATPSQFYTITTPSGRKIDPPPGSCWRVTKPRLEELIADNRIWFGEKGNNVPRRKIFLTEANEGLTPHTLWQAAEVGTTDSAKKKLVELFGGESVFDTPKPVELIKRIIQLSTSKNDDVIMDFFAGSCTTAQATLELNEEDGGTRKYILVQLPEQTNNKKYPTIADIGRKRINLVIKKIKPTKGKQLGLIAGKDLGFSCYKLINSNFSQWKDFSGKDTSQLEMRFDQAETPLVEDWTPEKLLTEILLLQGYPLDSIVLSLPEFKANDVKQVTSEFVQHPLYVCLDKKIKEETVARLKLGNEDIFVCLDSALSDEAKVKLADLCNLKVI